MRRPLWAREGKVMGATSFKRRTGWATGGESGLPNPVFGLGRPRAEGRLCSLLRGFCVFGAVGGFENKARVILGRHIGDAHVVDPAAQIR